MNWATFLLDKCTNNVCNLLIELRRFWNPGGMGTTSKMAADVKRKLQVLLQWVWMSDLPQEKCWPSPLQPQNQAAWASITSLPLHYSFFPFATPTPLSLYVQLAVPQMILTPPHALFFLFSQSLETEGGDKVRWHGRGCENREAFYWIFWTSSSGNVSNLRN